jgi:polyisoprenoid-binding protein YceI
LVREDLPVWEIGAAKVATPIKITAIETSSSGALRTAPGFFDPIYESIDQAEPRFDWQERVELRRADRMFYVDFYPYLDDGGMPNSGEGTLYLSMAIYSQFHCHDPVWTLDGEQLNGPWQKRTEIFAKGYGKAAEEIARQIEQSELGDGFVPIMDQDQPRVPWSEPYFKLPAAPEGADRAAIAEVELVQDWQIDTTAQDDRPAVMFAFPAPQDAYSGEATYVTGNLKLGEDLSIEGMRGKFIADPASVTMGEPDLDAAIHSSMLEVETYPESTFDIQRVETDFDQPQFNQVAAAVLHGRFTMRGETIPLSVPVSLEAFLGEDGKARLSIDGQWKLRLKDPFAIDGPPGDAPTNDTLIFNCHLVFEPAEGGE